MRLFNVVLVFLLGGMILISGCTGLYGPPTQPTEPTPTEPTPVVPIVPVPAEEPTPPEEVQTEEVAPTVEVKEFTIRESNLKLSPATITVNKGDTVRITVINDQGTHNLFVEGYTKRVSVVSAGTTQVMEFVADKTGTFNMWCEVSGHRAAGMEGQVIVK